MLYDRIHGCKILLPKNKRKQKEKWRIEKMSYVLAKMINGQVHFCFVEIQRMKKRLVITKVQKIRDDYD
ncbi:MAG: hypothetical protein WCI04_02770 [archaeon]